MNLTITLPILVVSCVLLMISLRTGWLESLLLLVIPMIYAAYSAMTGVIVNLKLPKLEWTSEVMAIKLFSLYNHAKWMFIDRQALSLCTGSIRHPRT